MFTTKARGMGMGLSICKSIIENHNGRIWVSVGVPTGSVFHFELPVSGERKPDVSDSPASAASLVNEAIE
jgi:signal transduction histidine kinase